MTEIEKVSADEITPDSHNANAHTERGEGMVDHSLGKFGFRFAGTLDRNRNIVHGNNRHEKAIKNGITEAVIIKAEKNKQYFLQFDDLDLNDPENDAREIAYVANRTAQVSIDFAPDVVAEDIGLGLDLGDWFEDFELEVFTHDDLKSFADLEKKYGEPGERDFWPYIRVQVAPDTMEQWERLMDSITETDDEAVKVEIILGSVSR